jgi:hypothetical protein
MFDMRGTYQYSSSLIALRSLAHVNKLGSNIVAGKLRPLAQVVRRINIRWNLERSQAHAQPCKSLLTPHIRCESEDYIRLVYFELEWGE